jgi:hypothetical protein
MMKRLTILVLLLPLTGCAIFDDFSAFAEPASPCVPQPAVNACAAPGVVQTAFPAQTVEPPR